MTPQQKSFINAPSHKLCSKISINNTEYVTFRSIDQEVLFSYIRASTMVSKSHKFLLKIGNYFGLLPWINYETCELLDKRMPRVYPAIVASVLLLGFIRITETSKRSFRDSSAATLTTFTIYAIIQSCFIKRREWTKLLQIYGITRNQIFTKLNERLDLDWKNIFLYIFYVVYLTSIRIISHFNADKMNNLIMYIILILKLTSDYLPLWFLSIITKGFKIVNKHSKYLLIGERFEFNKRSCLNGTTSTICRSQYKNVYNISVGFNNLFSWLLAMSLLNSLITMFLFTQFLINQLSTGKLDLNSIFMFAMIFMYRLVSTFSISLEYTL